MTVALHGEPESVAGLAELATDWIGRRLQHSPVGVVGDRADLVGRLAGSITDSGLGLETAWQCFEQVVAPHNVGLDSERFLAFIPLSPSVAAVWMDSIVSAANFSAESWLEAAGAVAAENQVIELFCREAGLPPAASGCFMSGGSIGNLSALAVGREQAGDRRVVAVADTAHASVDNALYLLGLDTLVVPTDADCRLTADALRAAIDGRNDVGIIVASGGSTNAGVIDDLAGCADVAEQIGAWLHVDGAYGLAAMLLPELRDRFGGIERADSFIVDPHKWLFATAGSCAVVYRDPAAARAVHTQHGPYIDLIRSADDVYNPSDLGFQLTRRASGLPVWFALVLHGLDAHRQAIRHGIFLAAAMADALAAHPLTALVMRPELGVVLFRRRGWSRDDWSAWATRVREQGVAFVAPTTYKGEAVGRLVFMHPRTPATIVGELMQTLTT